MQRVFQQSWYIAGTLAANHTIEFIAPFDMQLIHVSLSGSNANDATLAIGKTGATSDYLAAKAFGDSEVAAEYDRDDMPSTQFSHIPDGTNVILTVDYDGAAGTAIQNACIVLTFTEG